jgi:hypothetical protein
MPGPDAAIGLGDRGDAGIELELHPLRCASALSSSANWRQLPTSSSGNWMARAERRVGVQRGLDQARLLRLKRRNATPGIAQHLQAGFDQSERSRSLRSNTRWPSLRS